MSKVLQLRSELRLETRCENQIANEITRGQSPFGDTLQTEDFHRSYPKAKHRPVGPSRKYNCHGLTFASRRTVIWQSSEIDKIIEDDDYEKVIPKDILPGDIALYIKDGDIEHSGIVLDIKDFGVPLILSKWGVCHEVIHLLYECPYDAGNVVYYRIRI